MRNYNTKKSNSWIKSKIKPSTINKEEFINICNESESMAHACSILGLHFTTFKKYALKYNCYDNKKGKKFILKSSPFQKGISNKIYSTEDIIYNNKYPRCSTGLVKRRLLDEKIKEHKCEKCNLVKWNDLLIPIELNHKDGNRHNHYINNLEFLCPNCHAQTINYRGKNKKRY